MSEKEVCASLRGGLQGRENLILIILINLIIFRISIFITVNFEGEGGVIKAEET